MAESLAAILAKGHPASAPSLPSAQGAPQSPQGSTPSPIQAILAKGHQGAIPANWKSPSAPSPTPKQPSFLQQVGEGVAQSNPIEATKGALKGAASTVVGAADLASKLPIKAMLPSIPGANMIPGKIEDIPGVKPALKAASDFVTPSNKAQEQGQTGEMIGEVIGGSGIGKGLLNAARALPRIAEQVSAKMTPTVLAEEAAKMGTKKSLLTGKITVPISKAAKNIAKTVIDNVPDFNPKGLLSDNLNRVKVASTKLATDLAQKVAASGKNIIYPFKELSSAMDEAIAKGDVSIGLKGTQFEKQAAALKDAALKIAQDNGGKIADLFPARKEFDALVEKIYPNLYDKEYTPIRNAVQAIRSTMTDFTEKYLPDEVGLKQSLKAQSNLLTAIDNMSEKIASGVEKEIGTSRIGRVLKAHPNLTKAGGYAIGGAATVLGAEQLKNALPSLPSL